MKKIFTLSLLLLLTALAFATPDHASAARGDRGRRDDRHREEQRRNDRDDRHREERRRNDRDDRHRDERHGNDRDDWHRNEEQREYLFQTDRYYTGENIFYKGDVAGNVLQTIDRRNYNWGAYIGGFTMERGSTVDRPRIVGEKNGSLYYSRNLQQRYRRFEAVIAPSYVWRSIRNQNHVGTCRIFLDGREVYARNMHRNDGTERISINLQGVRRFEIQLEGKSLCFFDPYLIW